MKRKIIEIDESKCNGCGLCIPNCPEGALQVIDGKARLVSDLFCDGLGACVGNCPIGAMKVVEREAEPYDERRVMREKIIPAGHNTIMAHLRHLKEHGAEDLLADALEVLREHGMDPVAAGVFNPVKDASAPTPCQCPGSIAQTFEHDDEDDAPAGDVKSELRQWPVQLMLVSPNAPYFNNADLLVSADCVPFAYGDFHNKLLKGKAVVTFCPKLDQTLDIYVDKLTEIFRHNNIKSVTIARMEVPCCGGTEHIVRKALAASGKEPEVSVKVVSLDGSEIIG
ncbi:MAG: 4Fe-4S dicluster domain-containing protein [Lentisphaerae bacterium]|nr:4Fe-4S dicluster domain-containing protein [Lentisphaerota bacterium]MCP4102268.1 4Fe-4S dicluster domain-containing protein [Lentisphaerota bacterium]